ncbi:CBS domain-containing protein [Dethiosulfatarculus sandiegensis]|uniref:CBS domain-containing protein n=1 Tax=Dethiosulfatarculus sandiegensis TaxID=1429043 RepID=A0A0D2HPY8_9BACT|nr:CBS domain-containing protein [Dethiosulfatarculus sandiegensis]KIX12528.1 hypothetical protein X474_18160 [Dethiosulfatarculus sandiegensis]
MILKNWMKKDPVTVDSDTLVEEAERIINKHSLRALPVVDQGRLRGLVTRRNLYRSNVFVARTQDPNEMNYFLTQLKVKDIMIRMPRTVQVTDSVEAVLRKGAVDQVSLYPVLDGETLVGICSSVEIFRTFSQILGVSQVWKGITLRPVVIENDTLSNVAQVASRAGARLHALFTLPDNGEEEKKVVLRFEADDLSAVVEALDEAGYGVLEQRDMVQLCEAPLSHKEVLKNGASAQV